MKLHVRALALLLFALAAHTGIVWGQAIPPERPAVAYAVDGVLYLATESGEVVQKIEVEYPIGDFAISPDLKTVVFAPPHPGEEGGPLFVLDVASGNMELVMPDPYFNDDSVAGDFALFYSDPEFSPDGKQVVFATHAYGDGNEVQLSGLLVSAGYRDARNQASWAAPSSPTGCRWGTSAIRTGHPTANRFFGNVEGHSSLTDAAQSKNCSTEVILPAGEGNPIVGLLRNVGSGMARFRMRSVQGG